MRLDQQLNTNNRLQIHYGVVDARDLNVLVGDTLDGGGIGAPSDGHNTFLRDQSLVGSVNTVLKPNVVNTFLVQYARRHYNFPAVTGQPNLDVPNTLSFGHNFGTFDALNESRQQLSDSLAYIQGNHYWKVGTDVNFIQNFVIWPGFTPMRIVLPSINCLVDFANYVNPNPTLANQIPSVLTAGPCPLAAPPFFPPPNTVGPNPFDPLNGVPIVFWGAPVGSGPIIPGSLPPVIPTTWQHAYVDPQDYYVHLNHHQPGLPRLNTGPPGSFVTNSGGGIDPNSRIAYSEQASLQVDQELSKGLVLSVGYLFLRARKQFRPLDLNVCPPGGLVNAATDCPAASVVNPAFVGNKLPDGRDAFSGPLYSNAGLMYYVDATGNAAYNGGTISITDRLGQYFRFNANYTLSHTTDDGTFLTFVSTPEDLYERKLERADSVQDVRHRFVGNFTADAPSHGPLRNFEFSSIVTLQSPRPFTMFVGNDVNGDTNPVTDRVGWSPRNAYRGDDFYTFDLRLARLIHLSERMGLNLAFDAFNVFNRQNINEVTSVYGGGTPDFCGGTNPFNGPVPKHYNDATSLAIQSGTISCLPVPGIATAPAPDRLFGTPRTMFNPRQLQASAKFTF